MAEEKTKPFGPFEVAENRQSFGKISFQGFAGSGKTRTACEVAKGLWGMISTQKPVAFVDTETGGDFVVPLFKEWQIPLVSVRTRSFKTLMEATKSSVDNASILIIDSISAFWSEMQKTYRHQKVIENLAKRGMTETQIKEALSSGKYNRAKLTMNNWVDLKEVWKEFTDLFLNSPLHIIICGRAKWEYDFVEDEEENVKEIEKTGTSMMAEKELSFEPSLLVEMRHEPKPGQTDRVDARFWDHVAYVLKDRSDKIDGMRFVNPTFEMFRPHFDYLSIGGKHAAVESGKKDSSLFAKGSGDNPAEMRNRAKILLEEIRGVLVKSFPGRTDADSLAKQEILYKVFKTYSWTKISDLPVAALKEGLEKVKTELTKKPKEAKK